MGWGLSNIPYGFLNPFGERILVDGWAGKTCPNGLGVDGWVPRKKSARRHFPSSPLVHRSTFTHGTKYNLNSLSLAELGIS